MELQKTDSAHLSNEDILTYISNYESQVVPHLTTLWNYYRAKNEKISQRKTPDANNPDNKIIVPYGRKIITTFTGYGYRPRYITYKANVEQIIDANGNVVEQQDPIEEKYMKEIQQIFDKNNEHIKTSRAGRNTGIFGLSYELLYIDKEINVEKISIKAEPKFFTVDPREMIVLYDYSPEPKIVIAIRYYKTSANKYNVEVYYKTTIETYTRIRKDNATDWELTIAGKPYTNFFGEVPVVAYYMGDEMSSIIEPVLPLIDALDVLYSDSMNEFDRFAFAYLIMKKFGLTDPTTKKDPSKMSQALSLLKRRRVFEYLPADADIKFLTKDIPTAFIQYMQQSIKEQIHIQSHVPDFTSPQMASGVSGIAIQRLLFLFENLVSSAEADFDVGLLRRIELLTLVLTALKRATGTTDMITISHKRNTPVNLMEFAQTSATMKQAGLSRYLCADIWPDDIIPNVEEELARQDEDMEAMVGSNPFESVMPEEEIPEEEIPVEEEPIPEEEE